MNKEILKKEMLSASEDLLFMNDLSESMKAFENIDDDTNLEATQTE